MHETATVVSQDDKDEQHQLRWGRMHKRKAQEFTFRFNRRTSRSRGLVFRRLLEQAVVTAPITEAAVTHGYDW